MKSMVNANYSDKDKNKYLDHEWKQRAAIIGPAIFQSFPLVLIDQKLLQQIINDLSPPRCFLKRIFSDEWYDDELLDFIQLLKNHNWMQINWNVEWQVIPLFIDPIFAYCLPGIMYGIVTETIDDVDIVSRILINSFFYQGIVQSDKSVLDIDCFTTKQKDIIAEFVLLIRDLIIFDDPIILKKANDILEAMSL
jgi:hypothetical protein